MSLDVYLRVAAPVAAERTTSRIFVREGGRTVELSRAEWDERFPGRPPVTLDAVSDTREVFWANVTHNLVAMAREAGLYDPCWCPAEGARGEDLVLPLERGLAVLRGDRARFERLNPANGWGDYDLLVEFVENYLAACRQWPQAEVHVWK